MKYYKLIPWNLKSHGFTYQLGLNIDTNKFDSTTCRNGLHFSDAEHILHWVAAYGNDRFLHIAEVEIPEDEKIIEDDYKYKSHSIIIKSIRELYDLDTIKWIIESNIRLNNLFMRKVIRYCNNNINQYILQNYNNEYNNIDYYDSFGKYCIDGNYEMINFMITNKYIVLDIDTKYYINDHFHSSMPNDVISYLDNYDKLKDLELIDSDENTHDDKLDSLRYGRSVINAIKNMI